MNINPVSFGRTVKINAPVPVAERAAQLLNAKKNIGSDKKEKKAQQELKKIFSDIAQGRAQAVSVNGVSYIVTGEESKKVSDFKIDKAIHLIEAKREYKEGPQLRKIKSEEEFRYNNLLKTLINNTIEPISISVKYCLDSMHRNPNIETTNARIKEVNVMI